MACFKYKPQKIRFRDEINTLNITHKNLANNFIQNRDNLENKKKELKNLHEQLQEYDKYTVLDVVKIKEKSKIKKEIIKITDAIYDIENNISEINYYKNAGDLIIDYYNNDNIHPITEHKLQEIKQQEIKPQEKIQEKTEEISYLDKLYDTSKLKRKPKKTTKKRAKLNQFSRKTIMDFFDDANINVINDPKTQPIITPKISIGKNKATIFDQYMKLIDTSYYVSTKKTDFAFCKICQIDKLLLQAEGIYVCTNCGEFENIIIESDIPNYKDQLQEKPVYPYKRLNHFIEFKSFIKKKLK